MGALIFMSTVPPEADVALPLLSRALTLAPSSVDARFWLAKRMSTTRASSIPLHASYRRRHPSWLDRFEAWALRRAMQRRKRG